MIKDLRRTGRRQRVGSTGWRHQRQRLSDAEGPDERTRREPENLASESPVQVGPPMTDQLAGSPCTVSGPAPAVHGRFLGRAAQAAAELRRPGPRKRPRHAEIRPTARRSAGGEKLVRPRRSGTAQNAPTVRAGGTLRGTQEDTEARIRSRRAEVMLAGAGPGQGRPEWRRS